MLRITNAQLEVRIAAYLSEDPALMEVCMNDPETAEGDIHARTMRDVFGIAFEDRKKYPAIRVNAKSYLFGKLYGLGPAGAIQQIEKYARSNPELGIRIPTMIEARRDMRKLDDVYSTYFNKWTVWTIDRARQLGYAEDAFGGRRYGDDLYSPDVEKRMHAERWVVNMAVQGTAAKTIQMAMNVTEAMNEAIAKMKEIPGGSLLLQVHDELVLELDDGTDEEEYKRKIVECMELGQPFSPIPLVVTALVGNTWKECHG